MGLESVVRKKHIPISHLCLSLFSILSNKVTSQSTVCWKQIHCFLFQSPPSLPASLPESVSELSHYNIHSRAVSGRNREDRASCFKELVIYLKRQKYKYENIRKINCQGNINICKPEEEEIYILEKKIEMDSWNQYVIYKARSVY